VPGNLIPDVLTSQLRDPDAGRPVGKRVLRIATHPDHRRRGYASRLLTEIASAADVDWLGTSYGATPGLLAFWDQLGYRTVHLSARRNPTSGEHSAIQLKPHTSEGEQLTQRSEAWLLRRLPSVLADALDDVDPDLVRAALAGLAEPPRLDIGEREWRLVAAAAYGPGVYDIGPRAFRQLAIHHLVDGEVDLDDRAERLLVTKVLQAREWGEVAEELGFQSKRMAMRGLGEAYQPLVDAYGDDAAHEEADRFR
jgi:tRNA(Met) cytidine acetyltransferase